MSIKRRSQAEAWATTIDKSEDRINLFLFQATENAGWRNYGLPARAANGDRISNPPLALDLSYLLTAYGSGPLHAEALLGYAMFVLHEMPVLTRDAIAQTFGQGKRVYAHEPHAHVHDDGTVCGHTHSHGHSHSHGGE